MVLLFKKICAMLKTLKEKIKVENLTLMQKSYVGASSIKFNRWFFCIGVYDDSFCR